MALIPQKSMINECIMPEKNPALCGTNTNLSGNPKFHREAGHFRMISPCLLMIKEALS